MILKSVCQAQYLTRDVGGMRKIDYDATHMVKAVKGLTLNSKSYSWVPIGGTQTKITEETKDKSIAWFAAWAAEQIEANCTGNTVIIPIPSSKSVINSPANFRTAMLAQATALALGNSTCWDGLRFIEARPSSREAGGSRDPEVLYPNLDLRAGLPKGQIVLLDDLHTSGGHFTAATWKMLDAGRMPVLAVACGRSLDEVIDDPMSVPPEDISIPERT